MVCNRTVRLSTGHAVILHDNKAYSSAAALALLAREELGSYRIVLDFWRKAEKDNLPPTVEEVRTACDDHEQKQRRAQVSTVYRAEGGTRLIELVRARMKYRPGTAEYQRAAEELKKLDEVNAKRAPADRHFTRMRALYVDLNDSGAGWNRPSEMTAIEATNCLADAVNDYSVQLHRLDSGILRSEEPELAGALEAWRDRPGLPPAVWPSPWERAPD